MWTKVRGWKTSRPIIRGARGMNAPRECLSWPLAPKDRAPWKTSKTCKNTEYHYSKWAWESFFGLLQILLVPKVSNKGLASLPYSLSDGRSHKSMSKSLLNIKESTIVSLFDNEAGNSRVLVAKFFMKRRINLEATTRTLRSMWRDGGNFDVRDLGNNTAILIFDDEDDPKWILMQGPWSFDKYLIGLFRPDEAATVEDANQGTLKEEDQQYGAWLWATIEWFQVSHVVRNKPTQYPPTMAASQQEQRLMARFLEVITGESTAREGSSGHSEVQPTQVHESIDREIGKCSQNSTIGLDGDMDQGEGHTNMKDMDGDYVDQPFKYDGECNVVKDVFNFQARTEDQIQGSRFGLKVPTTVVKHANVDVLNGMEGVGPQEIKG
uniref:DUF4283 domain-containing protein n=1 Tax=Quercus lobata TaxID=97700 RepID=A0A7N2N214_QUELO